MWSCYAIKTSFFLLDEDYANKKDMTLDGSIISLEFAPMTKGIRVSKIPRATSSDDIRYKFSNPKTGGGEMTDMMLNKEDGVANVSFEKSSGINPALYSMFAGYIEQVPTLSRYSSFLL